VLLIQSVSNQQNGVIMKVMMTWDRISTVLTHSSLTHQVETARRFRTALNSFGSLSTTALLTRSRYDASKQSWPSMLPKFACAHLDCNTRSCIHVAMLTSVCVHTRMVSWPALQVLLLVVENEKAARAYIILHTNWAVLYIPLCKAVEISGF
jgi:hypothetical protein